MELLETWADIDGYEGYYQVSNQGFIRNSKGLILKAHPNNSGYYLIALTIKTIRKAHLVHRLVASAFLSKKEGATQVNHKDGNKLNNKAENLEWATPSENARHAWAMGLHPNTAALARERMRKLGHLRGRENMRKANLLASFSVEQWRENELVATHISLREAQRVTGFERKEISKKMRAGKVYKGFFWKAIPHGTHC